MKIEARVMFFDGRMDYLPAYKLFCLDMEPNEKLVSFCHRIKELDESFDFEGEYPLMRINGWVVHSARTIQDVVEVCGSEWRVEPVSKYRCINDLIIDESDFWKAFERIEPYASMEDRFFFASLKDIHYASATFEFDKEYIGDAVLITAHRMIKRGNPNKEAILKAISEDVSGLWSCEFEVGVLGGKDYSGAIEELRSWIEPPKPSLIQKICSALGKKRALPQVQTLQEVPLALYRPTSKMVIELKERGAIIIDFSKKNRKAGQTLLAYNPDLAYKKGAAVLLDAMDSGAELLVCSSKEDAEYFRSNFGNFERASGREIYIEIIAFEELQTIKEEVQ